MLHKQIRIRSGMLIQLATLIIFTTLIFFLAVYFIIITPSVKSNASNELSLSADKVEDKLSSFFDEISAILHISEGYFHSTSPTIEESDFFVTRFAPVLQSFPNVSAIILSQGARESILFKESEGYRLRVSNAQSTDRTEIWQYFNEEGQLTKEVRQAGEYDTRTRPWNIGASQLSPGVVFWTNVYTFYTKNIPGMTISTPIVDVDGTRKIVGMDISLQDISQLMQNFSVSKNGFAVLLDEKGNMITLPKNFSINEKVDEKQLMPYTQSNNTNFVKGYQNFIELGAPLDLDLYYKGEGGAWISRFQSYPLGGQKITVALFAPLDDFASIEKSSFYLLFAFLLILLLLAILLASIVSRWISFPISRLLSQSESIGRLDFEAVQPIKTRWYEINMLYNAQVEMARLLKKTTDEQDEIIQNKTLELLKYSYVIEQAPISIVITNLEGNIEYVNPHFSNVTGYTLEEALGQNPRVLKSEQTPAHTYVELWEAIT